MKQNRNGNTYFNISLTIRGRDSMSIGQSKNLIVNSLRAFFCFGNWTCLDNDGMPEETIFQRKTI